MLLLSGPKQTPDAMSSMRDKVSGVYQLAVVLWTSR